MKPVQLRLQAFGPFATSQTVDFFRVFHGGLFLIHGRTGAGKTSLLDGLCFSLFGRPSTSEREKDLRALRSHLANDSLLTETELIFTVGEEAFRVHRIPSQQVPRKRGEGFTELKGSAELWRFHSMLPSDADLFLKEVAKTENWIPVASKLESVDREIEALLGMNERQFRQVVILPQGKFREFLSSSSAERQVILERLFQTDRFSRLQSFFATHVRDLESQWKTQTQEILAKLKSTGLASADEIPLRLEAIKKEQTAVRAKAEGLRAETTVLRDRLKIKEDFETTTRRLSEIDLQLSQLETNRALMNEKQSKVELYDRLAPYRTLNENYHRGTVNLENLQSRRKSAILEAETLTKKASSLKLGLEREASAVPKLSDLKNEYLKLRELFPLLSGIAKEQAALKEERRILNDRVLELAQRKIEADRVAPVILANHDVLIRLETVTSAAEANELEKSDRALGEKELSYHQAEAARIALRLKKNQPCPVCGSLDHPRPAKTDPSSSVDLSSLKKAQEDHAKLREATSKLKAQRQTSLEAIGRLISSLGLKTARQAEASTFKPAENFVAIASETERNALQLMKARQELSNSEAAIAATKEAIETKELAIQRKIEEIPHANCDLDLVVSRGSEVKKQIEARESFLAQTTSELSLLEARLANIQGSLAAQETEIQTLNTETERLGQARAKELSSVLEEYPAFDITNWTCTKDERDRLQSENRTFETKLIQTLAAKEESQLRLVSLEKLSLATLDATSASGDPKLSSAENLKGALQTATLELQNSETSLARLTVESETLERVSTSIQSDQTKLDRIKADSERAIRLNGLLSGDRNHNKLAVPLSRFVLQSRFEDVLDQANRRLGRMSRGRYLLRRPALSHNLAQSQGLNLSVEDSMTGKERHADSLSGGESFMAALSLALGLADVVQADLGGVKLDSVIIDEGFGTLDSESLDLALRTLVDLQAGGRMVGVISHVQELKSQIDQRLEVIPSPEGSRLRWEADRATPH